jgi:hypothetical protein
MPQARSARSFSQRDRLRTDGEAEILGRKWDSNRMIATWHPFLYRSAYLNVGAPEC